MLFAKSAFTEYFIRTSTILWGENRDRYYYLYFPNDQLSSEWILFPQGQMHSKWQLALHIAMVATLKEK